MAQTGRSFKFSFSRFNSFFHACIKTFYRSSFMAILTTIFLLSGVVFDPLGRKSINYYAAVDATYNKNAPRGPTGVIKCFECRSDVHAQCGDPFNYTDGGRHKRLPIVDCTGMACVKVITHQYTSNQTIWRSCSSSKVSKNYSVHYMQRQFQIKAISTHEISSAALKKTQMVDITPTLVHVGICLSESNGSGSMCFCDESFCNAASSLKNHRPFTLSFFLMFLCSAVGFLHCLSTRPATWFQHVR